MEYLNNSMFVLFIGQCSTSRVKITLKEPIVLEDIVFVEVLFLLVFITVEFH